MPAFFRTFMKKIKSYKKLIKKVTTAFSLLSVVRSENKSLATTLLSILTISKK